MNRQQRRRLGVPREPRIRLPKPEISPEAASELDRRRKAMGFPERPSEEEFRRVYSYTLWLFGSDIPAVEAIKRRYMKKDLTNELETTVMMSATLAIMAASQTAEEVDTALRELFGIDAQ